MKTPLNITGKRSGKLVAVHLYKKTDTNNYLWKCKCDCGKIVYKIVAVINSGQAKSCGCWRQKPNTHHMSKTNFYYVWSAMKKRCFKTTNKDYKYYGARGIKVSDSWKEFINFKKDMYESYLQHFAINNGDTTIERVNNNGNYCKENCIWITQAKQALNRRS